MIRNQVYLLVVAGSLMLAELVGAPSSIAIREAKVLEHAGDRAQRLAEQVLGNNQEKFVDYTTTGGIWNVKNDSTWCSGFVPGIYWYLWAITGEESWRQLAMKWTEGVRSRATATDNDTGFQVYDSFGLGYAFDESLRADYGQVLLQGAATLVNQRYNVNIGCFRSWDQNLTDPYAGLFEVNIDQMMNLELILWAGLNGGPTEYVDYAVSHADKTWENNVRPDGSTYHVVSYNLDGTVASKRTHQGWTRDSTWSRGQAWAVYGYTMLYRYTGLQRMLSRAIRCYDYFIRETILDDNGYVPYSDFDAPLDSLNPRDTSAGAIVASAALELYQITGDRRYLLNAEAILESLSSPKYLTIGWGWQSILGGASEKWGRSDVGAIFADYFFLEALYRWEQADQPPGQVTGNWAGYDVMDSRFVDTGSWMGWLMARDAPYVYHYGLEGWLYAEESTESDQGAWFYAFRP